MKLLFWDTEINNFKQNRLIQLAWDLIDTDAFNISLSKTSLFVKPYGWTVDEEGFHKGRFTNAQLEKHGVPLNEVLKVFLANVRQADYLIAHNDAFDFRILQGESVRMNIPFPAFKSICTMTASKPYLLLRSSTGAVKQPKLSELYFYLFEKEIDNAHSADADVQACKESFFELVDRGVIPKVW